MRQYLDILRKALEEGDERTDRTPFPWTSLGEFRFKAGDSGFVEITNGNADGRVAIDGVRWVWLGE